MTVARSVASVLDDHVTLEVECVDRMYLNLYGPKPMYPAGVVGFFKYHRGAFRTEHRINPNTWVRYPFLVKTSAVVNRFYFYGVDNFFGPFFFKFGTYFPYGSSEGVDVGGDARR